MTMGIFLYGLTGLCMSQGHNQRIEAVRLLHGWYVTPEKPWFHVWGQQSSDMNIVVSDPMAYCAVALQFRAPRPGPASWVCVQLHPAVCCYQWERVLIHPPQLHKSQ